MSSIKDSETERHFAQERRIGLGNAMRGEKRARMEDDLIDTGLEALSCNCVIECPGCAKKPISDSMALGCVSEHFDMHSGRGNPARHIDNMNRNSRHRATSIVVPS